MKLLLPTIFLFGMSGILLAHSGATGVVKTRMDAMVEVSEATKVLGAMSKSGVIDPLIVQAATDTLMEKAAHAPELFEQRDLSSPTEALPAIWENYDDFSAKFDAMGRAARMLRESADDRETFDAAFRALGKTCQSCHEIYRLKK